MNRFIIVNGLPYLYTDGKAYKCRFDDKGFTPGSEITLKADPGEIYSELSIKAQCAGNLDSIGKKAAAKTAKKKTDTQTATE